MKEQKMALRNMVLKTMVGSHLYGTSTPESDEDYAGIFVPDPEYILGTKRCELVEMKSNPSDSGRRNGPDDHDFTIYSLPKYIHLAAGSNPNIIEILFSNNYLTLEPIGKRLVDGRGIFLSGLARKTFLGYAKSQIMKLTVKRGRLEAIRNARELLRRRHPQTRIDSWADKIYDPISVMDTSGTIYHTFELGSIVYDVERKLDEMEKEYGSRTRSVVTLGYDTKFASHIFRLLFEGRELLETGKLTFPFTGENLRTIMRVRFGEVKIEEVLAMVADEEGRLKGCDSVLPENPDVDNVSRFQMELLTDFWKKRGLNV
jgi:hypothetical protein